MSMQMDACFKKERIGTLFVWVGALEGGFRGGASPQGCLPQKVKVSSKNKKNCLLPHPNLKFCNSAPNLHPFQ